MFLVCAIVSQADGQKYRQPLGVYAHVDVDVALKRKFGNTNPGPEAEHAYLQRLYARLLDDKAVSGITLGVHWDRIEISDPACVLNHSCPPATEDGNDWSWLDDVFAAVKANANPDLKSVQLIITPGVDSPLILSPVVGSPQWLYSHLLPSCDPLFTPGTASQPIRNCGMVTFFGFPEEDTHADGHVLPLPWNGIYQQYWEQFLTSLKKRYIHNSAFVSIAIAGPTCASTEMILPTSGNHSTQASGLPADKAWSTLIANSFPPPSKYQNSDEVFIDQWTKKTIDMYESIFSGVTLVLSPDAGSDLPELGDKVTSSNSSGWLFPKDCSDTLYPISCQAKTEILSYFLTAGDRNAKATQVGGMRASSATCTGDIGLPGVKLLTSLSPPLLGGAQFDHAVSGTKKQRYEVGCPPPPSSKCTVKSKPAPNCKVNKEEAAYYVLANFFYGTPFAKYYGAEPGTAPMQWVEVDYVDIRYAQNHPHPTLPSTIPCNPSLQDLLNRASYDLFTMAHQPPPVQKPNCN